MDKFRKELASGESLLAGALRVGVKRGKEHFPATFGFDGTFGCVDFQLLGHQSFQDRLDRKGYDVKTW